MTTCVLLFTGSFSPEPSSAQETRPDVPQDAPNGAGAVGEDAEGVQTTPSPPLVLRPVEVGPWKVYSARMTGTGRVEARAKSASGRWVVSARTWLASGEQLVFDGDARLVAEDWVLQAPRITLEPSQRGWFALATRDGADGDGQEASNASLVLLFKEGIPIEAKRARVEFDSGKVSLEGLGRADRDDGMERKRESVREE